MKIFNKVAFTILELSIVIASISGIMGAVVIASALMESSKMNIIYMDGETYKLAINNFFIEHNCLPGDCSRDYIKKVMPGDFAVNVSQTDPSFRYCSSSVSKIGTTAINNPNVFFDHHKTTCAFWEMAAGGFISPGSVKYSNPEKQDGSRMKAGYDFPYVSKNKNLMWTLNTAITNVDMSASGLGSVTSRPSEIVEISPILAATFLRKHFLLLSDAKDSESFGPFISSAWPRSRLAGPLPSRIAEKLDTKFDDGYPYTGNIVSGRNGADSASNSAANPTTPACTILTGALAVSTVEKGATYNTHSSAKCITAFLIGKLNNDESQ